MRSRGLAARLRPATRLRYRGEKLEELLYSCWKFASRRIVRQTEWRESEILCRRSKILSLVYALTFNPVPRESAMQLVRGVPLSLNAMGLAVMPV